MTEKIKLPDYYKSYSLITDPGMHSRMFDVFCASSVEEIVEAIHGLFIHVFWAGRYGMT